MHISLTDLELKINSLLASKYRKIRENTEKVGEYFRMYGEIYEPFYQQKFESSGQSPGKRSPNQAHMSLYTDLMQVVKDYLASKGLAFQQTLEDTFATSLEYHDSGRNFAMRFFRGTIVKQETQEVVALYLVIVPHLHGKIEEPTLIFPESPWIHIIDPYKK